MSGSLDSLYQQLILDEARAARGRGLAEGHAAESFQVNPTCGDQIRLRLHLSDDRSSVERVSWEGLGCMISQASASVMTGLVAGRPVAEVVELGDLFRELMRSRGAGLNEESEDRLGDATAFTGTSRLSARVKCALLGWMALHDTLVQTGVPTTTEEER